MTIDEARDKLREATQMVDWINFARVLSSLGEYGYNWNKYDGGKLRPNYELAWSERKWFAKNAGLVVEALEVIKSNGKQ